MFPFCHPRERGDDRKESGDTVNILSTSVHGIRKEDIDNKSTFVFVGNSFINFDEIEKTKTIKKVARDPKFDFIADNNFPTKIGYTGIQTITKTEGLNE
mgnify:CR=1 FL=1